jgi:hypothetical protein
VTATRVGIELSPDAWRIVEIEPIPIWARRGRTMSTRVRSFAVLPPTGPETAARLASLKNHHAAVVVWDAASDHRQVVVDAGSYESMRAEAIRALDAVGVETRGAWIDIAPAARPADRKARRPVVVAVAAAAELTTAVQPLQNAGIRVRAILTPAVALGALARLRRAFSTPDTLELYVALEERATCITLVRGGVLLASQTREWGFINEFSANLQPRGRDEIASGLAESIREFVASIGASTTDIAQVCLSGGLPEMRSMTAPLMEQLDVEVEPLDSLFGIDAARLPDADDEFRERGAELRMAWAAAADWPPSLNLLRARHRQQSKTMLARAAVAGGVAAGLLVGLRVQQSDWWRTAAPRATPRPAATVARAPSAPPPTTTTAAAPAVAASRTAPPTTSSPSAAQGRAFAAVPAAPMPSTPAGPPPVAASRTTAPATPALRPPSPANRPPAAPPPAPIVASRTTTTVAPAAVTPSRLPSPAPPAGAASRPLNASREPSPAPTQPPPASNAARMPPAAAAPGGAAEQRPAVSASPATAIAPPLTAPTPTVPSQLEGMAVVQPTVRYSGPPVGQETARRAQGAGAPAETALGFEAVLGTILYSPDRKLAIIDGRIVGPGDEIRGARIVEITPASVLLRDERGRLRRLTLASGGR